MPKIISSTNTVIMGEAADIASSLLELKTLLMTPAHDAGEEHHEGVHHPWIRVRVTMSPLATWLTSWASTASASSRLML